MCGIFFSLSKVGFVYPEDTTNTLISNRGPDSLHSHSIRIPLSSDNDNPDCYDEPESSAYLNFTSSVLALRGDHVELQPLVDPASQSVLCWNAEAWKIADEPVRGNDAHAILQLLVAAARSSTQPGWSGVDKPGRRCRSSLTALAQAISSISGPFSFVFYDGIGSRIVYGRDYLGRRSLLHGCDDKRNFKISSVCDGPPSKHFEEVATDGIHVIDLMSDDTHQTAPLYTGFERQTILWETADSASALICPIPPMNKSLPYDHNSPPLRSTSSSVHMLEELLRHSLARRVKNIPELQRRSVNGAKVAVLFSGGLDCTVLARLAHELVSEDEPIDLLNVAFENPRVSASAAATAEPRAKKHQNASVPMPAGYDDCPDRKTGRSSYHELRTICPGRRWRFVCINIPYTETQAHRDNVKRLMRPHNTEMDLSISLALYFASRGVGEIHDEDNSDDNSESQGSVPYATSARVLLSGLGADEIFAGYTRHGSAFSRRGYQGLIDEVELDVGRLGKRNLGRDDRIISHWGREVRYPFLDEAFVSWALQQPVWEKCGFRLPAAAAASSSEPPLHQHHRDQDDEEGVVEGGVTTQQRTAEEGRNVENLGLDPEKQALRLVAWNLGMKNVAREKKRAIQFGSRTAKMQSGKTKGTTVIS